MGFAYKSRTNFDSNDYCFRLDVYSGNSGAAYIEIDMEFIAVFDEEFS
jgi:hypothetical protein